MTPDELDAQLRRLVDPLAQQVAVTQQAAETLRQEVRNLTQALLARPNLDQLAAREKERAKAEGFRRWAAVLFAGVGATATLVWLVALSLLPHNPEAGWIDLGYRFGPPVGWMWFVTVIAVWARRSS